MIWSALEVGFMFIYKNNNQIQSLRIWNLMSMNLFVHVTNGKHKNEKLKLITSKLYYTCEMVKAKWKKCLNICFEFNFAGDQSHTLK